jgi:hypothetical protein
MVEDVGFQLRATVCDPVAVDLLWLETPHPVSSNTRHDAIIESTCITAVHTSSEHTFYPSLRPHPTCDLTVHAAKDSE